MVTGVSSPPLKRLPPTSMLVRLSRFPVTMVTTLTPPIRRSWLPAGTVDNSMFLVILYQNQDFDEKGDKGHKRDWHIKEISWLSPFITFRGRHSRRSCPYNNSCMSTFRFQRKALTAQILKWIWLSACPYRIFTIVYTSIYNTFKSSRVPLDIWPILDKIYVQDIIGL